MIWSSALNLLKQRLHLMSRPATSASACYATCQAVGDWTSIHFLGSLISGLPASGAQCYSVAFQISGQAFEAIGSFCEL